MKKYILLFSLVLLIGLSLFGCKNSNTASTTKATTTTIEVKTTTSEDKVTSTDMATTTTVDVTTEAPTTEEPTTKTPTTETPTTEAPTTVAPTTTEVPTTKAPTTEAPTTKAPTTEAPTTTTATPTTTTEHVHLWDNGKVTTEPTCTETGVRTYTCSCGETKTEVVLALGHNLVDDAAIAATCTETGKTAGKHCTRCDYKEGGEVIPAKGHSYTETSRTPATCTENGSVTYTCSCGDGYSETLQMTGHNYVLSEDKSKYVCQNCKDEIASGKTELSYDGEYTGSTTYQGDESSMTYLFIGSSITNGYDGTVSGYSHYSMADMFAEDYLVADYSFYSDPDLIQRTETYLRKIEEASDNKDGVGGTYHWYTDTIILDGNGSGSINGNAIKYEINGDTIYLKKPTGYVFSFTAKFHKGDTVYKYAADGYTLSGLTTKYTSTGVQINPNSSYVYLMKQALSALSTTKVDTVIIQLSTNDVGQYTTAEHTEHIPFGTVSETQLKSSECDYNTSFGALEWLVQIARETWGCDVIIYTCHMSTGEYATYKANNYDETKVSTTYSEMYDACLKIAEVYQTGLINMWANKDVNVAIHEDATVCLADSLHLHKMGYEKVIWPFFRKYVASRKEAK